MNFEIPNSVGQIRQDNHGDTRGELWGTFNIDLSSTPEKIKVSKRMIPMDCLSLLKIIRSILP